MCGTYILYFLYTINYLHFTQRNGHVVGLSPNIRIYRYSPSQFFDAHCEYYGHKYRAAAAAATNRTPLKQEQIDDDSNNVTVDTAHGPVSAKTTWTLLLYLTSAADGCLGGETVFFPDDVRKTTNEFAVTPETGMLLLHKHGNDCMLVSLTLCWCACIEREDLFG